MHCLRRATSRLTCSSISSTPAAVSLSRFLAHPHSLSTLRLPSHSLPRSALQTRYYSSESHNHAATPPLQRNDRDSSSNVEDNASETVNNGEETLGKRALRHRKLDAFDAPRAPSETVYVGNLFFDLTAEDLRKHMEQYGVVLKAVIVHDNRGLSKGFGYVQFDTVEEAKTAIEKQHMGILAGRASVVQYARSHINEKRTEAAPSNTLFIGGIPFELTDRDLQELFRDVKNVIDVRVPVDRRTGMPRGFAHAEFLNVEYARRGKEVLMRKEPYGRKLRVHFAERKRIGIMTPDNENKRAKFEQRVEAREARQAQEDQMREAEEESEEGAEESLSGEYVQTDEKRIA